MGEKKVGIVGGGQLGRMIAMESSDLGADITVLDPTLDCPASAYAAQVVGDFKDEEAVYEFGKDMDVITFETESANSAALLRLEAEGVLVQPSPQTLAIIKDKYEQKRFLEAHSIGVAPFTVVETRDDITEFASKYTYPVVLKSRFGAYDGKGNQTITGEEDIDTAMEVLGTELYVEAWVPFQKELAVVAARDLMGSVIEYPVVETVHTDHICDTVTSPALVSEEVRREATFLAAKIMELFHGAGVFGIEMFLTSEGDVLVNEIAPRVHNSGHGTLGGSSVSQFKQHMLAVLGERIEAPQPTGKAVVMKNILGERNAPAVPEGVEAAESLGARVDLYGKHDTKEKRKMGHITVVADSIEEAHELAQKARALITI